MMALTGCVAIPRACSMLWPETMSDYVSFSDTGMMTLLIYNWKETQGNPASADPIPIEIPAPTHGGEEHPRAIYLKLMRRLLDLGGTMSHLHSPVPVTPGEHLAVTKKKRKAAIQTSTRTWSLSAKQATESDRALAPQFISILHDVFGSRANADSFCPSGESMTAHSCRKTGASLATLAKANETALTTLGMWALKSGIPKTYRNHKLHISSFSLALYDWLIR